MVSLPWGDARPRAREPRAAQQTDRRQAQPRGTVARHRGTRGRRFLLAGSAIVALLALAAIGPLQVLQTSETAATGYEIRDLERERARLAAEVRLLEADVAGMARVQEVERQATERLGMVRPEETMRLSVGVPAPESPPLPERYIVRTEPTPTVAHESWWEQLLGAMSSLAAP